MTIKPPVAGDDGFPFNLPLVRRFGAVAFESPVTFFVGENGCGKSTILEALACAAGLPAVGGDSVERDATLEPARQLAKTVRLVWTKRTHKGFFLRAEDFFSFARRMAGLGAEMAELADDLDRRMTGYGKLLARGAALGQRTALAERYGGELDQRSHGESFLKLFQSRLVPGGLYLLDEPEAPLSPQRQLALMALFKEAVVHESAQFVIATHSPILMGFPDAALVSFDAVPPQKIAYEEVEHVSFTKDFLNHREAFLRHL
jgi:predicted ATPase